MSAVAPSRFQRTITHRGVLTLGEAVPGLLLLSMWGTNVVFDWMDNHTGAALLLGSLTLFGGIGWALTGVGGCVVALFQQIVRLGAILVLLVLAFLAFPSHSRDDPCASHEFEPNAYQGCIGNYRVAYYGLLGALVFVPLASAGALWVTQRDAAL
ncbi:MAG: hypothetical protein WEC75_08195 [Dehalococcoidia bacterium]